MPKTRPRYNGSVQALVDVIAPSVTCSTWLTYGQRAGAKLNKPMCLRHVGIVRGLTQLMPSLSFKRADLKSAMAGARGLKRKEWPQDINQDEEDEWDEVQVARLTTMLRHVAQARTAQRAWVDVLFRAPAPAGDDEADACADEVAALEEPVWVGYDYEQGAAYRKFGDHEKATTEFSKDWIRSEGDLPTDPARVRFPDGATYAIAALTVEDLAKMNETRENMRQGKISKHFWSGPGPNGTLRIRIRQDLEPLLVIEEDGALITMVKQSFFFES